MGVGAAVLVPLFLNMISSDIVEKSATDCSKLLIFIGFCVIAAVYSKKFIRTVSEKVLKEEIGKVEKSVAEIKKEQQASRFYNDSYFHIQNKNFDLALQVIDEWIKFDSKNSLPYLGKAKAFKEMGKYKDAVEMTSHAIDFKDDYQYKGYYNRACYKTNSGEYSTEDIVNDLRNAIKLHPAYKEYVKYDADLSPLKDDKQFIELTA